MEFTENDRIQFQKRGVSPEEVNFQMECLKNGPQKLQILRPATLADGIHKFTKEQSEKYVRKYDLEKKNYSVAKFVPASGAASRMFKSLYESKESGIINEETRIFLSNIRSFVFSSQINTGHDEFEIIEFTLTEKGLNFGFLPKALIPFHSEEGKAITPLESHLIEAIEYATDKSGKIMLHFTFSPEHIKPARSLIFKTLESIRSKYSTAADVQISTQKNNTDSIAVDENNIPVRDENNQLVFRPAGHGALLENLQETESDMIFIRNIDNILPPDKNAENIYYKKVIGGVFMDVQQQIFNFLNQLSESDEKNFTAIEEFCKKWSVNIPTEILKSNSSDLWHEFLNRPVRVCGMVKNSGQPGGGPFWVKNKNGTESLQIIESAQFFPEQDTIMQNATHFNPNDMVVSFKDHKGNSFGLKKYSDPSTYFISEKSYNGKKIKALELPGLWNGGMADWLTIFVEIPSSVFNPVKTINDLLKKNHRT